MPGRNSSEEMKFTPSDNKPYCMPSCNLMAACQERQVMGSTRLFPLEIAVEWLLGGVGSAAANSCMHSDNGSGFA